MLYLGIDQHARQITISLRDDSGDVLQARQVSTRPEKLQTFFAKLTRERLFAQLDGCAVSEEFSSSAHNTRRHIANVDDRIRPHIGSLGDHTICSACSSFAHHLCVFRQFSAKY